MVSPPGGYGRTCKWCRQVPLKREMLAGSPLTRLPEKSPVGPAWSALRKALASNARCRLCCSKRQLAWPLMMSGLAILAIGFFLGMRHATDPDHVIAVSTIVSRERSLARAAWVGAFWGLGHTITIVLVGAAIVLFTLVIPPRVGLTMEFAVGLMLLLLGVLNLTGVSKWLSEKFSPAHPHVTGEHRHIHEHGSQLHYHWHSHQPAAEHHAH